MKGFCGSRGREGALESQARARLEAMTQKVPRRDEAVALVGQELPGLDAGEVEELVAAFVTPSDVAGHLAGLATCEILRLRFLMRAGRMPPGTPTAQIPCAQGGDLGMPRTYYRAGEKVPGVDLVPNPIGWLSAPEVCRLDAVDADNPDVDVRAAFEEAVNSRSGKVGARLAFRGSPSVGTDQVEALAHQVWYRFRSGEGPCS